MNIKTKKKVNKTFLYIVQICTAILLRATFSMDDSIIIKA